MDSYETILSRMENKYYELTGTEASRAGDTEIRLRLLAGEIHSLGANIDWLRRQLLPDTATGSQLDEHARQCGITRGSGAKAVGDIAFTVDMPLEFDVEIPAGTVCSTSDGALRFVTTEAGVIQRGGSFSVVTARAEHSGRQYNVSPGMITTIVTYFSVGLSIENSSSFSGGTDDEDDDALRARIAESYKNISNGANAAYYISMAKSVDGIYSASAIKTTDTAPTFNLNVAGRGGTVTPAAFAELEGLVADNVCAGVTVYVRNCTIQYADVTVAVKPAEGYTYAGISADVESAIRGYFLSLSIGEPFTLAKLGRAIINTEGVANYSFSGTSDVIPPKYTLVTLRNLTMSELT